MLSFQDVSKCMLNVFQLLLKSFTNNLSYFPGPFCYTSILLGFLFRIPYNGNHPRKKSFANYLLCHSLRENFHDSGNLVYKNSSRDKRCKKTFTNASRFTNFANFFFRGQFLLYSSPTDLLYITYFGVKSKQRLHSSF